MVATPTLGLYPIVMYIKTAKRSSVKQPCPAYPAQSEGSCHVPAMR
jgi:hypothetical protein